MQTITQSSSERLGRIATCERKKARGKEHWEAIHIDIGPYPPSPPFLRSLLSSYSDYTIRRLPLVILGRWVHVAV